MIIDKFSESGGLIIDNFAGGGGASTGIQMALGRAVDIAINHDAKALAMHAINHPTTKHYCEDVWSVNPRELAQGRPIDLVWLSPDCKHFSKAKGGKPVEKKIRGLAWVALKWASLPNKPKVIMLENVEEFVTWGPLTPEGMPCKKNKGREFNAFVNALRRQGYVVDWRELVASDYGTPTIRKRLFLIARSDGEPIVWPEITHGNPKKTNLLKWSTAADCIDWSIPCPSIFTRTKPLADNTLRRVAKGLKRYVIDAETPFVVPTAGGLLAPFITEHANASSQRSMSADEPLRTQCAQVKGGHFSLVVAFLVKHYTGVVGSDLNDPLGTITTVDHHSLVTAELSPADETPSDQVNAFLIKYYGVDQDPKLEEPLHTITTRDRFALVLVERQLYRIKDIRLRMLAPRELFRAQSFPDTYIIGDDESQGLKLSKKDQVRMVGNSVCPFLAAALVRANLVSTPQYERISA